MLAAYAARQSASDPLDGLVFGERPEPEPRPGWSLVTVKAAGLNRHDLWSLMGVGLPAERLPMVLGCDGAGVDEDGNEVVVHAVVASEAWQGDETLDPGRTMLSEKYDGTLAQRVLVPQRNLLPKPKELDWIVAGCLSTASLTAYRMLFVNAGVHPGATVLVQGVSGGVATALLQLGAAAGYRMWATTRDAGKRERALQIGAERVFETGARLPSRVDAVMETVGAATWSHSVNALQAGGTIVISGATSGDGPAKAELTKIFFRQLRIVGSTMGTRAEFERLLAFMVATGVRPVVDRVLPLDRAYEGLQALSNGEAFGKVVLVTD